MADEYARLLAEYDDLASTATDISTRSAGRKVDSARVFAASQLFTNLCGRFITLLRLLPKSRLHGDRFEMWDTTSIAAVVRTIIEAAHAFDYLAVEDVPAAERDARFRLVELHYIAEYCRILDNLGSDPEEYSTETIEIEKLKGELSTNEYFMTLTEKVREKLLEGEKPFFKTNAEMAAHFGFCGGHFRALYKWLSNYAHSHPFAFVGISENRGRGLDNPTDRAYICHLLDLCNTYVAGCIRGYCAVFTDLRDKIPAHRWALVEARGATAA
jgi:hypothetical protein